MEPHPIPQNVTSFQFRLVGDMTLKQFLYLALGSGLAYFAFILLAPYYPLIAWPIIAISALSGIALAFLPIDSRPLDYWLGAFLKAVYSPTQRIWQKNGKKYLDDPLFGSRLIMYTSGLAVKQEEPKKPIPAPSPPPVAAQLPTQDQLQKTVDLARQAQTLQVQIIQEERTLNQMRSEAGRPTPIPVDYSREVNQILENLQRLINQASQIKQQLETVTQPEKETPKPEQIPIKEKVKVVVPVKPKPQQLALTSFPNVINGMIKDALGNYLEGVVAVIYDKEGLPMRALKSNKLGQFSGATPLPNGTYTLELEKDGFAFDVLQIELDGQVLPPLMITAKQ